MAEALGMHQSYWLTFRYKFSQHAGVVGNIALDGVGNGHDGKIPDNAIMLRSVIETVVAPTSGGSATLMLGTPDDTDAFVAATAFDNALFAVGTAKALTAGVPQKVDEAGGIVPRLTIAGANLTGGEFDVHVEVLPGR